MMSGGNSIYSPLPQSNSDSDEFSEEELHSSNERQRIIGKVHKLQKEIKPEIILNGKKLKVTRYKQLDNDRDLGIALNELQLSTDEINVLKPYTKTEKLSTLRKICFSCSLFLCFFTTIAFLWMLPCEIGSCPSTLSLVEYNSSKKIIDLELYGPISIVPNANGKNYNLIFLFKKSFIKEIEQTDSPSEIGGIICFLSKSEEIFWQVNLQREPKDIDCNLIDIDLDGFNDCLIIERNNLLKAIQSLSGTTLWDFQSGNETDLKPYMLNFLVLLPDLDEDLVKDLLVTYSIEPIFTSDSLSYFVVISGKTGTLIGRPMQIPHCSFISNVTVEKEFLVSYTCVDIEGKESVKTVSLFNKEYKIKSLLSKKLLFNQIKKKDILHKIDANRRIFYLKNKQLILDNIGHCPENCSMIVTIKDEINTSNNHVWTSYNSRSYGMIPVSIKVGNQSGFIFKYWQWQTHEEKNISTFEISSEFRFKPDASGEGTIEYTPRLNRLRESEILEYTLFREPTLERKRNKRTRLKRMLKHDKLAHKSHINYKNYTLHQIIERIFLIIFNETVPHSIKISQYEITQICRNVNDCQPNVLFHKDSLSIADIDTNGIHDLVSCTSSFINNSQGESRSNDFSWQLRSKIQIIGLKAEIFKL